MPDIIYMQLAWSRIMESRFRQVSCESRGPSFPAARSCISVAHEHTFLYLLLLSLHVGCPCDDIMDPKPGWSGVRVEDVDQSTLHSLVYAFACIR